MELSYVAAKDFCEALLTLNSCLDNHLINLILSGLILFFKADTKLYRHQ